MWLANKHKGHNKFQNKSFSLLVPLKMYREGCEDYGRFQFVISDRPDYSRCKVNFTFNPNYLARFPKSFNSMHKGDGFQQKLTEKSLFFII